MIQLIIELVAVTAVLVATFWYAIRGRANTGPSLGNNRPYPDGVGPLGPGEDEPPYMPSPVISEGEQFRRDADRRLRRLSGGKARRLQARSWMEEPGAMEKAGLVDRVEPPESD